jgi:hypothetical protein
LDPPAASCAGDVSTELTMQNFSAEWWLNVVALISLVAVFVYGIWRLARWSRVENARLRKQARGLTASQQEQFMRARRQQSWSGFFGASLTQAETRVGRALVVSVIVFVISVLVLLVVVRIMNSA